MGIIGIITLLLFFCGFIHLFIEHKHQITSGYLKSAFENAFLNTIGWFISGIVCIIIFFIAGIIITGCVQCYKTHLIEYERNYNLAKIQYENQIEIINSAFNNYPMENKLYKDINKNINLLFKLPEIKSNTILITQLEYALKYKDNMYNWEYSMNRCKQALDFHSNCKLISIPFISTKY